MLKQLRNGYRKTKSLLAHRTNTRLTNTMGSNFLQEEYPKILRKSLEGVLQDIMRIILTKGAGGNAVYIYFDPYHPKVRCPTHLIEQYPSGMPIVLQHRWRDLVLDENSFHVTLFFDSIPTRFSVPWASITKFYDETVGFGIDMAEFIPETSSDVPANQPQGGNIIPLFPNDEEKEDD